MKKNRMSLLILFWLCFWWATVNAETNKLDNIAACAGVVIGNGAIDFFMGDETAFDGAADVAYSAYLSEVFESKAAQVIIDNQDSWNEVKSASIKTIKRLLSAG